MTTTSSGLALTVTAPAVAPETKRSRTHRGTSPKP